jgi:hypothetical protein
MKNLLAATLSSILLAACMMGRAHAGANTSTKRISNTGKYAVSYEPAVQPVPKRQLHAWTIELRDREGHPVDGAQLRIAGGMPDHGHGLPTKPYVREALGNGRYVIEGMKFNMGGYWIVDLGIESQEGADAVRFELNL